jgi:hypothetical protein
MLASIGIGFIYLKKTKSPPKDVLSAVSNKAVLIAEINNPATWVEEITTNWKPYQLFADSFLNKSFEQLSTLLLVTKGDTLYTHKKKFAAAYFNEKASLACILVTNVSNKETDFLKHLGVSTEENETKKEVLPGVFVYIKYWNELVFLSLSTELIQANIADLESGASILMNSEFVKLQQTSNTLSGASVYFKYADLGVLFSNHINDLGLSFFDEIKNVGEWASFDLLTSGYALSMHGFSTCNDSIACDLQFLASQKAAEISIFSSIPEKISFVKVHQPGYYPRFRKNTSINTNNFFADEFVGKEWAHLLVNLSNAKEAYPLLIVESSDAESFAAALCEHFNENEWINQCDTTKANNFSKSTLNPFENFSAKYLGIFANYILIAENENVLKHCLIELKAERNLASNMEFYTLKEKISTESNLFVYVDFSSKSVQLEKYFNDKFKNTFTSLTEGKNRLSNLAFQYSKEKDGLYFGSLIMRFQFGEKKQEVQTKSNESKLLADVSSLPYVVKNHYSGQNELLFQDVENRIYLIDLQAKLLWNKQIGEKILGEVIQIDRFANDKLQMLFTTSDSMYLIDRNGDNVEPFPIALPSKAIAGPLVVDYENNKQYRIIVACENGMLLNYQADGKAVEGWNFKKLKSAIACTPLYFNAEKKDYIVLVDVNGNVHLYNRKGESIKKLKNNFSENFIIESVQAVHANKTNDLAVLSYDSMYTLNKITLNDKKEKIENEKLITNALWANGKSNYLIDGSVLYTFGNSIDLPTSGINKMIPSSQSEYPLLNDSQSTKYWVYTDQWNAVNSTSANVLTAIVEKDFVFLISKENKAIIIVKLAY